VADVRACNLEPHLAAADLPLLEVTSLCTDRLHILLAGPEQPVVETNVPHTFLLVALNLILAGLAETLLLHVVLQAMVRCRQSNAGTVTDCRELTTVYISQFTRVRG
jgi:hypothetical protein